MLAQAKGMYRYVAARPALRVGLQGAVSIALIIALTSIVQRGNLASSLRSLDAWAVALSALLLLTGYLINGFRWQLLLNNVQVRQPLSRLIPLYFIGLFFSLFLPTSAGGDAVRIYEVSRNSRRPAAVITATVQERLVGLGGSLLIGLIATVYYLPQLPAELRVWALMAQVGGALVIGVLLYPTLLFASFNVFWRRFGEHPLLLRVSANPVVARVAASLRPVAELPALSPLRLLQVGSVATGSILLGISAYYVLGLGLGLTTSFMVFCLTVPLVWIVRMLPVSLNGLGLGEGSFVFLMSLFAVPAEKSLALALALLALQVCLALLGGLILLLRVVRGTWTGFTRPAVE